jgi:hypothetical protein
MELLSRRKSWHLQGARGRSPAKPVRGGPRAPAKAAGHKGKKKSQNAAKSAKSAPPKTSVARRAGPRAAPRASSPPSREKEVLKKAKGTASTMFLNSSHAKPRVGLKYLAKVIKPHR